MAVVEAAEIDWDPVVAAVVGLDVVAVAMRGVAADPAAVTVYCHLAKKVVAVAESHSGFHA